MITERDFGLGFDNCWKGVVQHLLKEEEEVESKRGKVRRHVGFSMELQAPTQNILTFPSRKFNPCYAAGELLWYLSGTNDGPTIQHYAKSYDRFFERDGNPYGGYGPRLIDGLRHVLPDIRDPNNRQLVIPIFTPEDSRHRGLVKDLPCTTTLQLINRDGYLDLVATMRSNDVWLGMPNDVWCWTTLQMILCESFGLMFGNYYHFVGDVHLYSKDAPNKDDLKEHSYEERMADRAAGIVPPSMGDKYSLYNKGLDFWDGRRLALQAESAWRHEDFSTALDAYNLIPTASIWKTVVWLAFMRRGIAGVEVVVPSRVNDALLKMVTAS